MDLISRVLPGRLGVPAMSAPSGLPTLLFNIWYLQFKINQLIDETRAWEQPPGPLRHAQLDALSNGSPPETNP